MGQPCGKASTLALTEVLVKCSCCETHRPDSVPVPCCWLQHILSTFRTQRVSKIVFELKTADSSAAVTLYCDSGERLLALLLLAFNREQRLGAKQPVAPPAHMAEKLSTLMLTTLLSSPPFFLLGCRPAEELQDSQHGGRNPAGYRGEGGIPNLCGG